MVRIQTLPCMILIMACFADPIVPECNAQDSSREGKSIAKKKVDHSGESVANPEAEKHYRTAILALKSGDIEIAANEISVAVTLMPDNAVLRYNLALIKSKKGEVATAAKALETAKSLGLPQSLKKASDDLAVELEFAAAQRRRKPRILFGQGFVLDHNPGYANVLREYVDQWAYAMATLIAKEKGSFCGYSVTQDGTTITGHVCTENVVFAKYVNLPEGALNSNFNECPDQDLDMFNNCFERYLQNNAQAIGASLRDLDFDVYFNAETKLRWDWKDGSMGGGFTNWAEITMFTITQDGTVHRAKTQCYIGRDYDETETLGRNPLFMWERLARELAAPLRQLYFQADFE